MNAFQYSTLEQSPPARAAAGISRDHELRLRERVLLGDRAAWAAFQAAYGRLVSATVARVVGRFGLRSSSEEVHDILAAFHQDLWAADRAKLRAFSPERGVRLGTWVALLASHAAFDFLRRRRRDPATTAVIDPDAFACAAPDPAEEAELRERARIVTTTIAGFSEKDREFVDLYFARGLQPFEVATRMGISVKTVYSKKHKIQARLGALLGDAAQAA